MIQKGIIDGKIVEIVEVNKFGESPGNYPVGMSAIDGGNGIIYPIRGKTDTRPGVYSCGPLLKYKDPTEEEMDNYSSKNITDFSNPSNIGELIEKQQVLKQQERTILTTADNIFKPQVKPNDYPAMVAIKTAVGLKDIDLDSYAHRFGANFNNDRRLFEKPNITLTKLIAICDALDMKATLTLQDTNPSVPNPMNDSITVELTSMVEEEE